MAEQGGRRHSGGAWWRGGRQWRSEGEASGVRGQWRSGRTDQRSGQRHWRSGRRHHEDRGYQDDKKANKNVTNDVEKSSNVTTEEEVVVGTCLFMCPPSERRERQRLNEQSHFEINPHCEENKDDGSWMIKKYRRPAAGRADIDVRELRPPATLLQTLEHLFAHVLPWESSGFDCLGSSSLSSASFLALYHFVNDRIRSIRQDFTIQRIDDQSLLQALERCTRFYILSSAVAVHALDTSQYQADWSDKLHAQQLMSALVQLRALYAQSPMSNKASSMDELFAYDILLHLQNPTAISLLLVQIPPALLRASSSNGNTKRALQAFVAFQSRNYYQFFHCYDRMTLLEQCLMIQHFPSMWIQALTMMNKAFGKQDAFEIQELGRWMQLQDAQQTQSLCRSLNIHIDRPASDAWENDTDKIPTVQVKFKVTPLNDGLDKQSEQRLVRYLATTVLQQSAWHQQPATKLILNAA